MKKSFSLLELIIVILIISIISSYALVNYLDSVKYADKVKIKSELALIKNSIQKKQSENLLKGVSNQITLDNAGINEENTQLFSNVLEFPLLSTTMEKKDLNKWIKSSSNTYLIYLDDTQNLKYKFEDNSFTCKSPLDLCKEFE